MHNKFAAKIVVVSWLFAAAALGLFGYLLGMNAIIPGPASREAILSNSGEVEAIKAGLIPKDSALIILSSKNAAADLQALEEAKENLFNKLKNIQGSTGQDKLFEKIETTGHTLFDEKLFLSDDKQNVLIVAHSSSSVDRADKELKDLPRIFREWQTEFPLVNLSYLSNGTADLEMFELIDRDLDRSLIYTLPLTFAVLLVAFRSLTAAAIPLIIAIVSLSGSLGIAALYSHLFKPISATSSQLVVLLVLAIGIDYSLFLISRTREEVSKGASYPEAITKARSSAGTAIFWSGLTVALSLFGLLLMNDTILTSMAVVSITAVILTVISSLVFLPALLLLLQEKIEIGKIPFIEISKKTIFFHSMAFY